MKLIIDNVYDWFGRDVILEFEKTIIKMSSVETVTTGNKFLAENLYRYMRRLPYHGRLVLRGKEDYFVILMGIWYFWKTLPRNLFANQRHVYLFDAWYDSHDVILKTVENAGIDTMFFSSLKAGEILADKGIQCHCHWVPEGLNAEEYHYLPYEDKDIDVLNFGRKWDWYHDRIKDVLEGASRSYLYEKKWFDVIFPTPQEFKQGLARSKISICFPKNISHPEIAGDISTMTNRYLQSMASKCLIVGTLPEEMKMLFKYNPVIEIDRVNPGDQLLDILDNYETYIPLIEKNYQTVCAEHTWVNRWRTIARYLGIPVAG